MLGNIGSGKSTLLNKLTYKLQSLAGRNSEKSEYFQAKKSVESVTTSMKFLKIENLDNDLSINLIDTRGFGDPKISNLKLWD